jgi:hypothetical protein
MRPKLREWLVALLVNLASLATVDLASAAEPLKSGDWMYRVTYNPVGKKVVEVRWAVQSIDNVKVVQIPWDYRSLLLGLGEGPNSLTTCIRKVVTTDTRLPFPSL